MSLDRSILSGKEHRRIYQDSRRYDRTCRAHGSCDWCCEGRQHGHKKAEKFSREALETFLREEALGLPRI